MFVGAATTAVKHGTSTSAVKHGSSTSAVTQGSSTSALATNDQEMMGVYCGGGRTGQKEQILWSCVWSD